MQQHSECCNIVIVFVQVNCMGRHWRNTASLAVDLLLGTGSCVIVFTVCLWADTSLVCVWTVCMCVCLFYTLRNVLCYWIKLLFSDIFCCIGSLQVQKLLACLRPVWYRGTSLPSLSIYFLIFSPFFTFLFLSLALLIFFFCSSLSLNSTRIVPPGSRMEVVGGDRTWV